MLFVELQVASWIASFSCEMKLDWVVDLIVLQYWLVSTEFP